MNSRQILNDLRSSAECAATNAAECYFDDAPIIWAAGELEIDFDELEEKIRTQAYEAITPCSTWQAFEIVDSSDFREFDDGEIDYAGKAKSEGDDWRDLLRAEGDALCNVATSQFVSEIICAFKEEVDNFSTELDSLLTYAELTEESIKVGVSNSCPYGWAAHDYETEEGVCVWKNLEGELTAISHNCEGLHLYACWSN
ncbi:hypothetical protein [Vibrio panuliri]|uniref:DUF2262 domain-containing protein n=1 Tax=Vibrio panuliri TaxID=1381081 RepID=A0ABX3FFI6_9VIBR|nr:hypothetical protein [Vibrio panuliri]KAB1460854.1 hypothetical protein F7O85_00320 [Vibrio panuliri]OLQ91660.1 hypothetical protein BIY20_09665 [Vibrio panuliri]